jgi:N utilization substance protein B
MQSLYEYDFRKSSTNIEALVDDIVLRNINEFRGDVDEDFIWRVVRGSIERWDEASELILEAAPEWPLEQVAKVDTSIIRVSLFEMLYDTTEDVPPRVSINEAIEIAKTFGGDNAPKFVNGVLGAIYRKYEEKLAPRDQFVSPTPRP